MNSLTHHPIEPLLSANASCFLGILRWGRSVSAFKKLRKQSVEKKPIAKIPRIEEHIFRECQEGCFVSYLMVEIVIRKGF